MRRLVDGRRSLGLAALALSLGAGACGTGGVDAPAVERATDRIRAHCASTTPGDDGRALAGDVTLLVAQLREHPDRRFRYAGGQVDLTMRGLAETARTTLWACAPDQAARIDRALREVPAS